MNIKDDKGYTPLHISAQLDLLKMTKFLLDQGADFDAKNHEGKSPLDLTVISGTRKVAKEIIAKGADINAIDRDGKNRLHRARISFDILHSIQSYPSGSSKNNHVYQVRH